MLGLVAILIRAYFRDDSVDLDPVGIGRFSGSGIIALHPGGDFINRDSVNFLISSPSVKQAEIEAADRSPDHAGHRRLPDFIPGLRRFPDSLGEEEGKIR
ncbi:hypothetical protein SDC9_204958 [bioreactor metagenome]|uniref:Uncharacterized protein n=1 Tax=bioreactor metagenome TaxID=1076179 RepID=A0A645J9W1_9ZZZZ